MAKFLEQKLATTLSPNKPTAQYSAGPKLSATRAIRSARSMSSTQEMMPPAKEAMAAMDSASEALPCIASGFPSRSVAAEEGVPGVRIRIAEMEPP